MNKKVSDVMTRNVQTVGTETTLEAIARVMAEHDIGSVPINDGERLVGMITDRDIVVRGLAKGHPMTTAASEVMSKSVKYCYDDQPLAEVAANMGDLKIRRLPVVDRDKRLIGMVSLANVAVADAERLTGNLVEKVATPH